MLNSQIILSLFLHFWLQLDFLVFHLVTQKMEMLTGNFDGWQILGGAEWKFKMKVN